MQTENQDYARKDYSNKDAAQDDTSDVGRAARRELDDAKARLSDAADRVRHEARNAGTTITTLIMDELDRRAADLGTQMRSVASQLRGEDKGEVTEATRAMSTQAADLMDDVCERLEGQSVRDMGHRLSQFGRENPALFVMGCLLTGALAGRMIVASDERAGRSSMARAEDRYVARSMGQRATPGQDWATQRPGSGASQASQDFGRSSMPAGQDRTSGTGTGSGSAFSNESSTMNKGRSGSGSYD